jgi:hypothetical protein
MPHLPSSAPPDRPQLDLSGPKLRTAMETLLGASEPLGGVERFAAAVKLKSQLFQQHLGEGRGAALELARFEELVSFMATVRRRIGLALEKIGYAALRGAIVDLLADADVPGTADERLARFCKRFPDAREFRFTRDLAAELLHNVYPEHYPMMHRWVWDAKANTGALREIWHGDNVDHMVIDVPDTHETFLVLREELSQFLSGNGVFSDVIWYVDLLEAQVYGDYINAQGGAYLKTEFGSEHDPLEHTRRILGLDGIRANGRLRARTIDGAAREVDAAKRLN